MIQRRPSPESACPYEKCVDTIMSNFDHEVDPGAVELLAGDVYGHHAAWNFHARVWLDKTTKTYKSEIWRYGSPQKVLEAETLRGLMEKANDEFGWE